MLSKTMNDRKDEPNGAHKRFIRTEDLFPRNKSIITIRRITGTKKNPTLKPVGSQTTFTSPQHWMQPNGEPN